MERRQDWLGLKTTLAQRRRKEKRWINFGRQMACLVDARRSRFHLDRASSSNPFWNLPFQTRPAQQETDLPDANPCEFATHGKNKSTPLDASLPAPRCLGSHLAGSTDQIMAGKLIANLIVMGSGIIGRAMLQAYRKALENANKTGVAHEAIHNIRRASKTMTEQEARQILGVSEQSTWEEIVQRYDNLFERNAKSGSFYLQSKVHQAKECLENVYQKNQQDGTPT